jgi:hypothetical protein
MRGMRGGPSRDGPPRGGTMPRRSRGAFRGGPRGGRGGPPPREGRGGRGGYEDRERYENRGERY